MWSFAQLQCLKQLPDVSEFVTQLNPLASGSVKPEQCSNSKRPLENVPLKEYSISDCTRD